VKTARPDRVLGALLPGVTTALACAIAAGCGPVPPEAPEPPATTEQEETMTDQDDRLTVGTSRRRELGGVHSYQLPLLADQFVEVVVEQEGVDVAVELDDPDGTRVITVDTPTGRIGPERLVALADRDGTYRLRVRAIEPGAPAGSYRITVEALRPATAEDRRRAAAERTFSQGEEERRTGTRESLLRAVERYGEALEVWRALPDRGRQADTRLRLGLVREALGELHTAVDDFEQARALYRELDDRRGQGIALNYMGFIRSTLGEREQALADVREALALARVLDPDSIYTAEALNNLGRLYRQQDKIDEALDAYDQALALYRAGGEPEKEALVAYNVGVLLLGQGKPEEAEDRLDSAIRIWKETANLRWTGLARVRLGDVRKRQGRLAEARQELEDAIALGRRCGDRGVYATALNSLGTVLLLDGENEQARARYEEALAVFREIGARRSEAFVLSNLGRLSWTLKQPERALEFYEQAAPLVERLDHEDLEATISYGIARAHHDRGNPAAARERLDQTLGHVERLRAESAGQGLRMAFFATKQHYYELYVEVLMALAAVEPGAGHEEAAFMIAERRRARGLLDLLGQAAAGVRRGAEPALLDNETAVRQELNELEERRMTLADRGDDDDELAAVERRLREKRLELDRIRGRIREQTAELLASEPATLDEIRRQLLDAGTLLVTWSLGEERSFVWLVSPESIEVHPLPPRTEIEKTVLSTRRLLTYRSRQRRPLRDRKLAALAQMLLAPVAEKLDRRRLLIVADGALASLPFGVLPDPAAGNAADGPVLLERHEIVYAPSASVLLSLRRETAERLPPAGQLTVFANPVFANPDPGDRGCPDARPQAPDADFHLDPLPATEQEARTIYDLVRGPRQIFLGHEATKQQVLEPATGQYQILHLATHGLLNRDHPELSGLAFSLYDPDGCRRDGILRLHEIYNLDLKAELVVLSACRTGLGAEVPGEGVLGLTRGFMYAGAPRVIVSLWEVSDEATAELMRRFYWSMLSARPVPTPARALRAARLSMRADPRWQEPSYWAPFVLQGDWRLLGEGDPIEATIGGAGADPDPDNDYPGPDDGWCRNMTEPWQKDVCRILRQLSAKGDRNG